MKRIAGVVVIGGVALLIAGQFFKFNIGLRDSNTPLGEQVAEKVENAADAIRAGGEKVVSTISDEANTKTPTSDNSYVGLPLADVLIDGDKYLLLTRGLDDKGDSKPETRKEVAMYEVVRLARELPGDPTGIKVRIWRTPNATAQAESSLKASLAGADIKEGQIDYRSQLVESNGTANSGN